MPSRMRTTRKTTRLSPMSLLDRFREAVFRLIMISALSKTTTNNHNNTTTAAYTSNYDTTPSPLRLLSSRSSSKSSPTASNRHHHHHQRTYHRYTADSHQTEAVADCIEFIKRSSTNDHEENMRDSTTRGTNNEIVVPLPVM
ncbi:hypothetical protein OSB04_000451 [Centaurea solstitialis]|uniref:Uncharacterized protein n=1 Tax=Centaurea solstitialis TaxID=347529 RepID=A0AA38WS41_9ASTR|nr:hypothetical protein OSB04_000451 [Centaurea solstitialis]